jgi:hypothetical protein
VGNEDDGVRNTQSETVFRRRRLVINGFSVLLVFVVFSFTPCSKASGLLLVECLGMNLGSVSFRPFGSLTVKQRRNFRVKLWVERESELIDSARRWIRCYAISNF